MSEQGKTRLQRITVVYWVLLVYVVAALVWWLISLETQNDQMMKLQMEQSLTAFESGKLSGPEYDLQKEFIATENRRNTTKYVSEGVTFFLLILLGASFVYRAVRRQFRLQQQQQNFMMAVTHELKTPISVARLNLETLQKHQLDEEKRTKLIRMTLEETNRLNTLTNNILISSQLEGGGYHFSREELDLSDLLRDRVLDFRGRFPERNFNEEIESEIELRGDSLLLQMLINNLLENAIKYSPRESIITCRLKRSRGSILLNIIDEGVGIADAEKKKVFDKFYRVGNESTRKTQGTGLGLYLCRKIAADHDADIAVTNNHPAGSNFAVNFKRR